MNFLIGSYLTQIKGPSGDTEDPSPGRPHEGCFSRAGWIPDIDECAVGHSGRGKRAGGGTRGAGAGRGVRKHTSCVHEHVRGDE